MVGNHLDEQTGFALLRIAHYSLRIDWQGKGLEKDPLRDNVQCGMRNGQYHDHERR